jgi:hypothetical protein
VWELSTLALRSRSAQGKPTVRNFRGMFIVNAFASLESSSFCSKLVQNVTNKDLAVIELILSD